MPHLPEPGQLLLPGFVIAYRGEMNGAGDGSGASSQQRKKRRQNQPSTSSGHVRVAVVGEERLTTTEGVLEFEEGDWVALPQGDGNPPLLDGQRHTPKCLACEVLVTAEGSGVKDQGKEVNITIRPGPPMALVLVDPPDVEKVPVPNAEALPLLRIKTLDVGNNVTAPRTTWPIKLRVLEEGVLLRLPRGQAFAVGATGEGVVDGVGLKVEWRKEDKGKREVTLEIEVAVGERQSVLTTVPLKLVARKGMPVTAVLTLVEQTEAGERQVEVRPNVLERVEIVAKGVLQRGRVVLLDEMGEVVPPRSVGMEVTTSWTDNQVFDGTGDLPGLEAPEKTSNTTVRARVEVSTNQRKGPTAFVLELDLKTLPGRAHAIWFDQKLAKEVISGVSFQRVDSKMIAFRDAYKNILTDVQHCPAPTVEWISMDRGLGLTQDPPGPLLTVPSGEGGYFSLPHTVTLTGPAQRVKVRVCAPGFSAMKSDLNLRPGPPSVLLLAATADAEFRPALEMRLFRGEVVKDVRVRLKDAGGHNFVKANAGSVLSAYPMATDRASRGGGSERLTSLFKSELTAADVDKDFLTLPDFTYQEKRDMSIVVELKEGNKVLCSAQIAVQVYLVNRVTAVRLTLGTARREGSRSLAFTAGMGPWDVDSGPPAVAVQLETEDKEDLQRPPPEALTLTAEKGTDGRPQVVKWYETWEESTHEGKPVAVFLPKREVQADTGFYTVRATYREVREHMKLIVSPEEACRDSRSQSFTILPGPAVRLKPLSETLENASLSANSRKNRFLLAHVQIYPIDRGGRRTRHTRPASVTIVPEGSAGGAAASSAGAPMLAGADSGGRLVVQPRLENETTIYEFPQINLEKDVGNVSGVSGGMKVGNDFCADLMPLRWRSNPLCCLSTLSLSHLEPLQTYSLLFECDGLEPWSKPFTFVTDRERLDRVKALQEALGPLCQERLAHKRRFDEKKRQLDLKRNGIETLLNGSLRGVFPSHVTPNEQLIGAKMNEIDKTMR